MVTKQDEINQKPDFAIVKLHVRKSKGNGEIITGEEPYFGFFLYSSQRICSLESNTIVDPELMEKSKHHHAIINITVPKFGFVRVPSCFIIFRTKRKI